MNILAAILYFKMAAMKSNFRNIFIIRTGWMVISAAEFRKYCKRLHVDLI